MIQAYYLYTGPDGHSHVTRGSIVDNEVTAAKSVLFKETPPHATLEWHNAPTTQYVITLSGTLEFTMHDGETFTLGPGDILIALDVTGTGHSWRLVDDEPWRRLYVAFDQDAKINFQPDKSLG